MTSAPPGRAQVSLFDLVFILWAVVVPVGLGHRVLNNDGDLPRHLRIGEWMLEHGRLVTTDQFSYTMAGEPFLAFEWGSQLLYAAAYRTGGLAGVAVLAGLVLGLTYALVVRFLLRRGAEPLLAYLASMVAAMLGAVHWVARPHLFTMLLAVVLLELLERPGGGRLRWYPALFALWANLHGGFAYGLVLVGLYLAAALLDWRLRGGGAEARDRARALGLRLGAAALGGLLTPHGLDLYRHVLGFFGDPVIVNLTQEFMSPDFHQLLGRVFLLVVLLIVTGLALSRRPPATSHLLVLLANLAFALHSARNIELFGLTAVPLMALHFDADWRRLGPLPRMRVAFATEAGARRRGIPAAVAALLLAALGLAHGRVAGEQVVPDRFDERQFPVAAVAAARAGGLAGRLYTEFTWNGYVLLAWPEQRVFIDPGTDHYGPDLSRDEIRLWNLETGWDRVIERWGIRNMLLPATSRLAYQLARDDGWFVWYQDEVAVILRRLHGSETPSRISEADVPCRSAT